MLVDEGEAPPARKVIRQAWSEEEKCRIVAETLVPGASVSEIVALYRYSPAAQHERQHVV
jgi:transposase-like protein